MPEPSHSKSAVSPIDAHARDGKRDSVRVGYGERMRESSAAASRRGSPRTLNE